MHVLTAQPLTCRGPGQTGQHAAHGEPLGWLRRGRDVKEMIVLCYLHPLVQPLTCRGYGPRQGTNAHQGLKGLELQPTRRERVRLYI